MGWLGWPPDTVLSANIAHLHLAIAGKIDFVKKTNPWGSGDDKPDDPPPSNPAQAAQDIMAWARRNKSKKARGKKR